MNCIPSSHSHSHTQTHKPSPATLNSNACSFRYSCCYCGQADRHCYKCISVEISKWLDHTGRALEAVTVKRSGEAQ